MSRNYPLCILAGGRATRLGNLSAHVPKFLMPVSEASSDPTQEVLTFADVQLRWARDAGFRQVILSIGYLGNQVREYCQNGSRWNLQIEYCDDGATPLGTGGAIAKCLEFPFDKIAVTYGDTLLQVPIEDSESLLRAHKDAQALMCVFQNTLPGHTSNANLRTPWVEYSKITPDKSWRWIDYGYLLLKREFIDSFPNDRPLDLAEPLAKLSAERKLLGLECSHRFWEIGSPDALKEFQRMLK